MLYVTYSHMPKAFKRFVGKNPREVTLFEAESQMKAYQAVQTSSFFEMPQLEIKQTDTESSSALLKLELKSNEVQQEYFHWRPTWKNISSQIIWIFLILRTCKKNC